MFLEQNNRSSYKQFARYLATIRRFMEERDIIEVITNPLMSRIVPDRGVDPLTVNLGIGDYYLHTSPEWEMKKALCQGSGSIYQMVNVFRDDLSQNWHKPAFIMLEWYELDKDEDALIEQCLALFGALGLDYVPQIYSCRDLYHKVLGFDVLSVTIPMLEGVCKKHAIDYEGLQDKEHMSSWLEIIWVSLIEPSLSGLTVVKDFPLCQSALAKIDHHPHERARRFEILIDGCEIANGYFEETDIRELSKRFAEYQGPHKVVSAQEISNLPSCSGVSIGVERLYAFL